MLAAGNECVCNVLRPTRDTICQSVCIYNTHYFVLSMCIIHSYLIRISALIDKNYFSVYNNAYIFIRNWVRLKLNV